MVTVGIIGTGNVAWHLTLGFQSASGISVSWILGRNKSALEHIHKSSGVKTYTELPSEKVDLVLICVNDDSIQEVLNQLPRSWNVAYTSGTVSIDKLSFPQENLGVFYPLQSFTKERTIKLSEIPFLIEGNNENFIKNLESIAQKLSNNVQRMNSEQRKQLHIAAVFSNNFVNHLLFLAEEHLKDKNIDKSILQPLIKETINKAFDLGAFDAQSGPARRNDSQTIDSHQHELTGIPKEIYTLITESILKTYLK